MKAEGGPKGEARLDAVESAQANYRRGRQEERNRARALLETDERRDLYHELAYWRSMYRVMVDIIAITHPDPAYAWLDELTRRGAVNLSAAKPPIKRGVHW